MLGTAGGIYNDVIHFPVLQNNSQVSAERPAVEAFDGAIKSVESPQPAAAFVLVEQNIVDANPVCSEMGKREDFRSSGPGNHQR